MTRLRPRFVIALLLVVGSALAVETARRRGLGPFAPLAAPPAEIPRGEPAGCARYRGVLAEMAGGEVDPERLASLALADADRIEARLDSLAAALGKARWPSAFRQLSGDHPQTPAAVLDLYRAEIDRAERFAAARDLVPLPVGPLRLEEVRGAVMRRYFAFALYLKRGLLAVVTGPPEGDDVAYLANHCRICVPPLAVHEAVPGHHVAFELLAAAPAPSDPAVAARLHGKKVNLTFHEGWAQHGELIMLDAGYYDTPERQLGAWRLVLMRAVRAAVDVQLHCGSITPAGAEAVYRERLALDPEAASTEVHRHLGKAGVKATYYLGATQIEALWKAAREREPGLTHRDFAARLLTWPLPLPEVARVRFGLQLPPFDQLPGLFPPEDQGSSPLPDPAG